MIKDTIIRSVLSVALAFGAVVPTITPVFALTDDPAPETPTGDPVDLDAEDDYNRYFSGTRTGSWEEKEYSGHSEATNGTVGGLDATTTYDGEVSERGYGPYGAAPSSKAAETLYQVQESYTWTIHSLVDFGDSLGLDNTSSVVKEDAVKVTNSVIPADKVLLITVKDDVDFKVHNVYDSDYTLDYKVGITDIKIPDAPTGEPGRLTTPTEPFWLSPGDIVGFVYPTQNTCSTSLQFTLDTESSDVMNSEIAGDYIGQITYIASLEDNEDMPHYNFISFTIDGIGYHAIEGMPWGEWVEVPMLNIDSYDDSRVGITNTSNPEYFDSYSYQIVTYTDGTPVDSSEEIIDGYDYILGEVTPGPQ